MHLMDAKAVGIPQRTISFYEPEVGALPSTLVPRLAKVLGVSVDELLGIGDGAPCAGLLNRKSN